MRRLFWLAVIGLCAIVRWIAEAVEEHAKEQARGKRDDDEGDEEEPEE